jgi:hypothetical protein
MIRRVTVLIAALLMGAGLVGAAPEALAGTGFGTAAVTGGAPRTHAQIVAVRMAHHPKYDRFVIEFNGRRVPRFRVARQPSSVFRLDPSDKRVDLLGRAGVSVVLHGTTGQGSYRGRKDFRPRFPQLREARLIGDFEAVTTWGLGVRRAGTHRVIVLTAPPRLVVDVHH